MKKTQKCIICILVLALLIPVFVWAGALVKNCVLTAMHKDELKNLQFVQREEPLPDFDWYRITSYSDDNIEIYFVNTLAEGTDGEYKIGGKITCTKTLNGWNHTDMVNSITWSGTGSADNYIWPYWHHIFL